MRRATAALVLVTALASACTSGGAGRAASTSSTAPTSSTTAAPSATTAPPADLGAVALTLTRVGSFSQPLDLKWCAGHADPFVVQKTGQVRNFRTGQTILDLGGEVSTSGEQGMLGMTCTPDGGTLFVDYTSRDGHDVLDRFVMPADGAAVDRGTRKNVLSVPDPAPNHNGGNLVIGPDQQLWYGLGDGGGANDQYGNSQNPRSRLAKILRIDTATNAVSVAVSGVRNPWRFSFDRATGDLWIGDVGQDRIEEVDALPNGRIIGANLGWSLYEGTHRFKAGPDPGNLTFPVFEYTHAEGESIIGGYLYRGTAIPALRGAYLFADAYTAVLRAIVVQGGKTVQQRVLGVKVPGDVLSSFAEDPSGELYALSLGGGIFRIDPSIAGGDPTSAADAARRLDAAESVIHDTSIADDDPRLAAAGHAEQVLMHAYADHADWLAAAPARWQPTVRDDVAATTALRSLVADPKPTLPAWTVRRPKPIGTLRTFYDEAAARWGVPWPYLAAVHFIETKMGRIEGNSTAGAQGPMQFLPSTWAAYGSGDIHDDHDAILSAARYLAANGAPTRMHDALFRYNRSEQYVTAITAYAERMRSDPLAYRGYWGWQVYYATTLGAVWLREGYRATQERPVTNADL